MKRMRACLLVLPLLLAACAAQRMEQRQPAGSIRITADHYDSMVGVSLAAYGLENTTCRRDMVTGTHILRWYCSFRADPDRAQYLLDQHVVMAARTFAQ